MPREDSFSELESDNSSRSSANGSFAAASLFGKQRATSLASSSNDSQLDSTGGVVEFGDTGPFALRLSTLEYANPIMERNFLVYYHRGRNSSLGLCVMVAVSCLVVFGVRVRDAEPRYLVVFAAVCVALFGYCGFCLWRLKAQLNETFAAASMSLSGAGHSSGLLLDQRLQDTLCDNAAQADHVLFLMQLSNLFVVFTAYYPKYECYGLQGDARENVCVKRFQVDAAIVLLLLASAIVAPVRILRFVVFQTLCMLTFVVAHFIPGAIRVDRPFLTFSIGIIGLTAIMNVVQVSRHELTMRTQFEQFMQLKGYLAELNDVRRRIEFTLRSKAPEAWVRATRGVGEANLLTENVVVVCLAMRHFVPWSGVQGPKDVIEVISRVTDVFHRAKQTLTVEALRYPTIGDLWIVAIPVQQSTGSLNESVETESSPIGMVPPSTLSGSDGGMEPGFRTRRALASEALRFMCACVSEGCRVAIEFQYQMAEERESVPFKDTTSSSRWLMVDGVADMGKCTVVPLGASKATICGGPLLVSMQRMLRCLEASAEALGLRCATTAIVGEPVAVELDLPLTAASPTVPIMVPLLRDDGTTETSEVLLVRSAHLPCNGQQWDADACWPFELELASSTKTPSMSQSASTVAGVGTSTVQEDAGILGVLSTIERPTHGTDASSLAGTRRCDDDAHPQPPQPRAPHPLPQRVDSGLMHSATSVSSLVPTATIDEQLAIRREWLVVDVFAHDATEAAYRSTRLAAGTIELVICAVFFFIAAAGLVGAALVFSSRAVDTVNSSLPWALGACGLALGMIVASYTVHLGLLPVPPRIVSIAVEVVYSGLFVTAVVIDWVPGLLAGGSVAWAFFLEFVLMARPLWTGPISLWTLDATAAAAFTVVFAVGPRSAGEPSDAVTLNVAQSAVLIFGTLFLRLVMERDRRERFAVSHRMTLCKGELELQYLRLQESIEAFAPSGFAAELTKQQQRNNAHGALMAILKSGHLARQRRSRQAFMTTRVRDMILASVYLQPPPPRSNSVFQTSGGGALGDSYRHDLAYCLSLQAVDSMLVETLEAFNDALMAQVQQGSAHSSSGVFALQKSSLMAKASADPPPLQVVKTTGDTVMLSALDHHSVGGVSEAEGACLMVLFLKLLRARFQQGQGDNSRGPTFLMFVSSGPLVGSLIGQEAPTFEFFGPMASCHSAIHRSAVAPPCSIAVTLRVRHHCSIHWTFAAADVANASRSDVVRNGKDRSGAVLPRFTGAALLRGTSFGSPLAWRIRGVEGRLHVCLVA